MNTSNKCDYTRATYKNYVNSTTLIKQIENVITLDFPALWLRQIYCGKCLLPRFVRLAQCRLYQVLNCMEYFRFFSMGSITPSSYPWILSSLQWILSMMECSFVSFMLFIWCFLRRFLTHSPKIVGWTFWIFIFMEIDNYWLHKNVGYVRNVNMTYFLAMIHVSTIN